MKNNSQYIYLVGLGNLEEGLIERSTEVVSNLLGFRVKILPQEPVPDYAYLQPRAQYDALLILEKLGNLLPPDGLRIIALTEVDLCTLVLTFVFGAADTDTAAVVSTARLRQEFYKLSSNRELLLERLSKEIMHELGHSFGLSHCSQPHCVMSRSATINQIDSKSNDFCPRCQGLVNTKLVDAVSDDR